MEKRGRKQKTFQTLRVRGPVVFDAAVSHQGAVQIPLRIFSAVVRVVGDGADFFSTGKNTLGNNPTLVHESAGVWHLDFAASTFTQQTTAVINTLDVHPETTLDFLGDSRFIFRTLSAEVPADNLCTFLRVLIIDFV